MIDTYVNRIFGLIGATRAGKDSVANFLTETRGFKQMAFADQIKEEFGISKGDFEAAKIAGNIEKLRDKLWEFSARKKEKDPYHFINKVINKAKKYSGNVIITDIRTIPELDAFYKIDLRTSLFSRKRVYWIRGDYNSEVDNKMRINGSKFFRSTIIERSKLYPNDEIRCIFNDKNGLYSFYQHLDSLFFKEDIEDIWNKKNIRAYLNQYDIKLKESEH